VARSSFLDAELLGATLRSMATAEAARPQGDVEPGLLGAGLDLMVLAQVFIKESHCHKFCKS